MLKPDFNYTPYQGNVNPSYEGPLNARIIVIAEFPWKSEMVVGRPLAGAGGHKWAEWLLKAGLRREDIRIENLYPYKPPTREIDSVSSDELIYWIRDLHRRMLDWQNPVVVVPMGNYATFALIGRGKVRANVSNAFKSMQINQTEADKKAGITALRGSIYSCQDGKGRQFKVIPTLPPNDVSQMPKWNNRTLCDWQRIAVESNFAGNHQIVREHIIDPTEDQVKQYVNQVRDGAGLKLATDIETWGKALSCVGFSLDPSQSITIPTHTKAASLTFLPHIKTLCESPNEKILCNGMFDAYWLDHYKIQLNNFKWSVDCMHHALDPMESHSLAFLASIYTRQIYWKDEAKDAEEIQKYAKNMQALWTYNGLDCCVTAELQPILERELIKEGLLDFYLHHYAAMFEPLIRMSRHGVRVDIQAQKAWAIHLKQEMLNIKQELESGAGESLFAQTKQTLLRPATEDELGLLFGAQEPLKKNIDKIEAKKLGYIQTGPNAGKVRYAINKDKKSFSTKKLMKFFYGTLGLPIQKKRRKALGEFTDALDEGAIRKLNYRYPGKIKNFGYLLLSYREKAKELDYLKGAWDPDGRIRCYYKLLTKAGRLASSRNPMRTGYNLQNLKH